MNGCPTLTDLDRMRISLFLVQCCDPFFTLSVPCSGNDLAEAILSYGDGSSAVDMDVVDDCRVFAMPPKTTAEDALNTIVEVTIVGARPPRINPVARLCLEVQRWRSGEAFLSATWDGEAQYARHYLKGLLCHVAARCPALMEKIRSEMAQRPRTPAQEPQPEAGDRRAGQGARTLPRVPGRIPEMRDWVETWRAVERPWKDRKYPGTDKPMKNAYKHLSNWLKANKPHLACSPETLADIIRAGEAGLLEYMPELPN